jgi:hypothetical protein
VSGRVQLVNATGEDRNGCAAAGEDRAMRHPVDSVCATRHDGVPAGGQPRSKIHRHVFAVTRRRPRADDCHCAFAARQRRNITATPQHTRTVVPQILESVRPMFVDDPNNPSSQRRRRRQRTKQSGGIHSRFPPRQRLGRIGSGDLVVCQG